jgi:hypothetical protein
MNAKQLAAAVGLIAVAWHVVAIAQDAERCKANLDRWLANPTVADFVRLLAAEGVLIKDIGFLL